MEDKQKEFFNPKDPKVSQVKDIIYKEKSNPMAFFSHNKKQSFSFRLRELMKHLGKHCVSLRRMVVFGFWDIEK